MQINTFSDYTLRILIYLALAGDRLATSREIADTYDLSFNHIAKAAQLLARENYVLSIRGRGGGIKLAMKPSEISIGKVLRLTEAGSYLVECMRPDGPVQCILAPHCGLSPLLNEANEAFFSLLDNKTLADALPRSARIRDVLGLPQQNDAIKA